MEFRCIGCGAKLQDKDENKPGYIPTSVLEHNTNDILCKRCHNIKNYGLVSKNPIPKKAYYEIINKITKSNSLFVYIVDLFDFDSSFDLDVIKMLEKRDTILVLNKRDLLPKSAKDGRIKNYVLNYVKKCSFRPKNVILTSAKNKQNIDFLIKTIETHRYGRNCYVLGNTNVGKSSIINALIKAVGISDNDVITTSLIPATTLNLIEIPLFEKAILYDTPGIVRTDNLLSMVEAADYNNLMPKTEIKPRVFQLDSKQSLIIGGFARVDYLEGEKNSFVLYAANQIDVHRTKLEKALELFPNNCSNLFKVETTFIDYEEMCFDIVEPTDVVIYGLGFVSIKEKAKIRVVVPSGLKVVLRNAIFG